MSDETKNIWCDFLGKECPGVVLWKSDTVGNPGLCGDCVIPIERIRSLESDRRSVFAKRVSETEQTIMRRNGPYLYQNCLVCTVRCGVRYGY